MSTNLTKSDYLIYIDEPNKRLADIYWESCSGISLTSESIQTSNGKSRYTMNTRPVPQPITLSRAANVDDDFKITQWLNEFCSETPVIANQNSLGALLILLPLKPCAGNEPYNRSIKVYELKPSEWTMFDADIMSTTDMSRTSIVCNWKNYTFS